MTVVDLAQISSVITKGTTPTTIGYDFATTGIPFIRVQNLRDGRVDPTVEPLFISADTHRALARSQIRPGDVLISIAGTIGRTALVDASSTELNCNQAVAIVRPTAELDARYLRHWLNSRDAQSQMSVGGVTGTITNLSLSQIGRLRIPLPPLPEQRRIAAILDHADALRAKRRQTYPATTELRRALFLKVFGDPNNKSLFNQAKLGTVGKLDRGVFKHRPRNAPELLDGPYPLIQTGDIANSDFYLTKYVSSYSETGLKQSRLWPAGTLCITIAANIARTAIMTFDACFPDSVVGFTAGDTVRNEYVNTLLSLMRARLEATAPEVAQKNIISRFSENLKFPFLHFNCRMRLRDT